MKRTVIGFVGTLLMVSAPVRADCIDCPPGTIALSDSDGFNSGWCVTISRPENVMIEVTDIDFVADTVTLEITKTFDGPPGLANVFPAILMDFFQVCDDSETVTRFVIDSESIDNQTTSAWTDFHWILFNYNSLTDAWIDVPASTGFDTAPFGSAVFSEFIDPGTDEKALHLTATGGAIADQGGFAPGAAGGALVIQTDLSIRPYRATFVIKQRPSFVAMAGDLDLDGDVDVRDFATLAMCFNGPGNAASVNCPDDMNPDLDHDGDVDLGDFSILSGNYTGTR